MQYIIDNPSLLICCLNSLFPLQENQARHHDVKRMLKVGGETLSYHMVNGKQ